MDSNKIQNYQRSNEPIFWGLFGFGGMVIAFAFPILIGLMLYVGITNSSEHFHFSDVCNQWWGAAALFLILFGAAFHCIHRILFSLQDLKIHITSPIKLLAYGLASLIPLAFAVFYIIHLF